MPLTIGDARSQILDHLDDELGRRYAPNDDFTKVDRALRSALNRCLDDYVAAGGDRFDENVDCTTSASDGSVNLADEKLLHIRGVLVNPTTDGTLYPIDSGDKLSRGLIDLTSRDLVLVAVRQFPIEEDPNGDDLLVGEVNGAARSWDSFDEWVCARAALQLGIKDDEMRRALLATIEDLRSSIVGQKKNPASRPWPERRTYSFLLQNQLRWLWYQREQTLQLVFNARGWGV